MMNVSDFYHTVVINKAVCIVVVHYYVSYDMPIPFFLTSFSNCSL